MEIDEEQIYNKLRRLKVGKSCGPYGFHPRLNKALVSLLCNPLKLFYHTCIDNSCIPAVWRETNSSSIYKKGNKCTAKTTGPLA